MFKNLLICANSNISIYLLINKEKLQKDMERYLDIDNETNEMIANIAEVAANVGKFLKSPIISEKRDILRLILSDCKVQGKNFVFQ